MPTGDWWKTVTNNSFGYTWNVVPTTSNAITLNTGGNYSFGWTNWSYPPEPPDEFLDFAAKVRRDKELEESIQGS